MISEQAFSEFYQQTSATLRNYVARVMGNVTNADDIVQEAYLRMLRRPPPTDDPRELRAYLFRVASNLITDRWRRQKHEAAASEMPEALANSPDAVRQFDMKRMFHRLRRRDRQLMWLAYVEEASHREIAATLGLRERSIRVMLSRAREKLTKLLRGESSPDLGERK